MFRVSYQKRFRGRLRLDRYHKDFLSFGSAMVYFMEKWSEGRRDLRISWHGESERSDLTPYVRDFLEGRFDYESEVKSNG